MASYREFPYLEEAPAPEQPGSAGGSAALPVEALPAAEPPKPPVDIAAGMLEAIQKSGVTQEGKPNEPLPTDQSVDTRPRDAQGRFLPVDDQQQPGSKLKQILGADGKPIAPQQEQQRQQQTKKADDFLPSEEERKALSSKSVGRLHELHKYAKEQETVAERLTAENQALASARDNIMAVLTENKIEPDDFSMFASFNRMIKTGQLEDALAVVDQYRLGLLQALGRDAPGYDPLTEHADLKARVDAAELSREDALTLVKSRKIEAANAHAQRMYQQGQRQEQAATHAQEGGLDAVKRWNATLTSDIDYETKAATILPQLQGIIKDYPPELWVPTLDRLWKAMPAQQRQQQRQNDPPNPLRSSGAKAGLPAPKSELEALEAAGFSFK